ncbi:hypothetical protein NESM_000291400 [Novymonas esmeraldas]|uniref:Uncharacterized protein n=1 Tax=Novymonas esmeraldas TaxID=1808958 RepID=A0AAW0FC33_9TRYP
MVAQKLRRVSCTVDGRSCTVTGGTYKVKAQRGVRAVLLRAAAHAAPSTVDAAAAASAASAAATATSGAASATAASLEVAPAPVVICAVDAHGRFHVEDGGAYEVGCVRGSEELLASPSPSPSAPTQPQPQAGGNPTKYAKFVSKFWKAFRVKGYEGPAVEWRKLSKETKEKRSVDDIIADIASSGRVRLRVDS